jgi:hypothetical protein
MDSYRVKKVLGIDPESRADETPVHHLNDGGFVKCRSSVIDLQGFSFQSLYFVFLFMEYLEDSEDTRPAIGSDAISEPGVE